MPARPETPGSPLLALLCWGLSLSGCAAPPPADDDDDSGDDDDHNEDSAADDDDSADDDDDDSANPGESRVFVTSAKWDGALGGLIGGDARCQELADNAGLGGLWLAWLGDGVDGPASRFEHSIGTYRLVGGGVIAEGWEDLVDGTIGVPIDHDETGTALPSDDDMIVWTAVFHTGGQPTPVNCTGWTSVEETLVPTGLASATDSGWTVTAPYACIELHRLYCFEQ